MLKKHLLVLVSLMLVLSLVACSTPNESPTPDENGEEPAEPVRLNVATATTGGAFYPAGLAAAQLFTEFGDMQASASTSAGSVENVDLLISGEANIVVQQSNVFVEAYTGTKSFEGNPNPNMRILTPILSQHYSILVREGSGIESMEDWKGKRVVVGRAGSGTAVTHERVLGAFGITFDDIDASYLGQAEAVDALRNGMADATIGVGAAPLSPISDALAAPGTNVKLYSLTEEEEQKILEATDWMAPMDMKAGLYPKQDEVVNAIGHVGFFAVRDDMSEDLAYELVMLMHDNKEWLMQTYNGYDCPSFLEPADPIKLLGVPLHPGAERAFKELGLIE